METDHINVELDISGIPLRIGLEIPVESVKLRRMLPVFNQISNTFLASADDDIREQGREISCKAGCGACCRQLVPVSEAEAYGLSELVESMPEPRRSEIKGRFAEGIEKLNRANIFERLETASEGTAAEHEEVLQDYFRAQVACPFLENESCSIHQDRPISCREYLVTSPPELCDSAVGEGIENVRHFFQVKESVISISRNKLKPELPYVPLIRSLEFAQEHADDSPSRSGEEWTKIFFDELVKHSR